MSTNQVDEVVLVGGLCGTCTKVVMVSGWVGEEGGVGRAESSGLQCSIVGSKLNVASLCDCSQSKRQTCGCRLQCERKAQWGNAKRNY